MIEPLPILLSNTQKKTNKTRILELKRVSSLEIVYRSYQLSVKETLRELDDLRAPSTKNKPTRVSMEKQEDYCSFQAGEGAGDTRNNTNNNENLFLPSLC